MAGVPAANPVTLTRSRGEGPLAASPLGLMGPPLTNGAAQFPEGQPPCRDMTSSVLRPRACARALDRIRVPVLLLQGDADRLVPVSTALRLGASRPEWRLAVAGDVGHVPMMEVPEWTVERISEWLVATDLVPRAAFSAD